MNPGDTGVRPKPDPRSGYAQRRPGREPRRHSPGSGGLRRRRPLNEGRGVNPGDTTRFKSTPAAQATAQRRPGREPRRHHKLQLVLRRTTHRSTKAGAVNPGDTLHPAAPSRTPNSAQRRPGRCPLNEGRGVNPGDTRIDTDRVNGHISVAQRRPGREPRRHPATRHRSRTSQRPLNEGRGVNPGDTASVQTSGHRLPPTLNEGRGVNPGDTGAVLRLPVRAERSTKAGGVNPGDTPRHLLLILGLLPIAQRRPGREPRRHT